MNLVKILNIRNLDKLKQIKGKAWFLYYKPVLLTPKPQND